MENVLVKRYEFIDMLKALGILFVIFYHFNNLTVNPASYHNYFFQSILSVCVPIFFFVNGALLLNMPLTLKKHIKRLIRIVLLTICWGVLTLLILMPIKGEYMAVNEFLKSFATWKAHWINHLWYLKATVCIYIFLPLIKKSYDEEHNYLYFFLGAAFIMTFINVFLSNGANILEFILGKNYLKGNANFFGEFNPFRGMYGYSIVYFILGGLFFKYRDNFRDKKWSIYAAAAIIVSMMLLTAYGIIMWKSNKEIYDIVWFGYDSMPTLVMVIAIFILSLNFSSSYRISKLIITTGKNSLGIYFVHMIWGNIFIKYFVQMPLSGNIVSNMLFALFVLITSLFSVIILKRIPMVKNLFII